MSNGVNANQFIEKIINEDSSILSNSTNTSFSENILQDINLLKSKEIYLISKNLELRIPEILSYIQNDSNSIPNKLLIIKYLENLFTNVNYNSEIFACKFSNEKERLNLFQIIINQFINCTSDKDDYMRELKDLFIILLSNITFDKDNYRYIFSFLINYINKCNNNAYLNENQENNWNLNSEKLSRILQLLQIYYQSMQTIDEPYNYLYFNGDSDNHITITNKSKNNKKILNLDESLNILMFIKLLPSQIIKQVYPIIKYKILDIVFNDKSKMISIGIDKDNYLISNFTSEKLIQLKENKIISILVKLTLKDFIKVEIFVNNEKVDKPKNIIIKTKDNKNNMKEKMEIKELKFFKYFIGICSNIIIYKESEKNEGLPKFFLLPQTGRGDSKEKYILKSIYLNGFFKEELFSVILKQELRNKVDDKIIKELNLPIKDKSGEKDIKEFLEKNLISIYMPNRIILPDNQINKSYKNSNQIILKDSINNLDAEFNINSPNLNGVHIHKRYTEDFNPFGGLNHFLPIIELMTQNIELLKNENLTNFFNLISSVFMPSYLTALKNENDSNFFFNLSLFLEKIPDSFFDSHIATKLISISSFLVSLDKNYLNIIKQFYNYILMNEIILFKFSYEEQGLILQQIKYFVDCSQRENFSIDIILILNILLHYDKEKNNKFCCKYHADFFNEFSEIHSPELHILLKPMEEIISKLFEKFVKEASSCINKESETGLQLFKIYEMLTIDISPCLQKIIINQFFNYIKQHYGKYFAFLDKNRKMLDITLFIFKISIFDIKKDALNLLFLMNKVQENMEEFYTTRSRTNAWAYKNETNNVIDEEKSILIQNYILPFYLLGEGILVSSSSSKISNNDNLSNEINIEINKIDDNKSLKKTKTDKNFLKIFKKENKNKINDKDLDNDDDYNEYLTSNYNKNYKISKNGRKYAYIKITSIQHKIYLNFKKKKMNELILGLYANVLKELKEKIGIDFILNLLVKIVSKGDIILINNFLDEIKKKSEIKDIEEQIYNNSELLLWLLETSFQAMMIKQSNFDEKKYMPGFFIDPINEKDKKHIFNEEEKRIKVDEIFNKSNDLIINIIKNNIYKLDFVFTWSKYYYEMRNENNNYKCVKNLVLKIVRNSLKLPYEISLNDKKNNFSQKKNIYFLNLLFELLTFYRMNAAQNDNIKQEIQIDEELFGKFPNLLLIEINNNNNNNNISDNNIMKTLNIKWKEFPYYEKIYSYFKPLWITLLDKKKKEYCYDTHIFKKYSGKKNVFINELELLFYSFNDIEEFNEPLLSKNYANKGIKIIYMVFHFFILLFNVGGNETEINNLYNEFRLFITLLIISSSTLIVSSDMKKQKWPNESQNKEVQDTIQLLLCYNLYFFINKIKEIDTCIENNNEISKDDSINNLNNFYYYIRQKLFKNLGYLLKLLSSIYKERNGKSNISKCGSYKLAEALYSFIEGKDSNNNENFLDNILKINIKSDTKEIDTDFEKNVYSFIYSSKIKQYLFNYINDENNKSRLYPFGKYIIKREKLIKNIIPYYDNRANSYHSQKKLCLMSDYYIECQYDKVLEIKIGRINRELIKEIFVNQKKINLEEKEKISEYKRIKKQLFSFKGIWSKEEFFYESKYHLKYKLVNHLTEDFSKILLTPILDVDYYLPIFSHFSNENLFRNPEKQIPIYYLTDLSFALNESHKSFLYKTSQEENLYNKDKQNNGKEIQLLKDDEIDILKISQNQINTSKNNNNTNIIRQSQKITKKKLNALFDIKLANYSFYNDSNSSSTMEQSFTDSFLFSEFISLKHLSNSTKNNIKLPACLVKTEFHICGIFYNNSQEIGFYSSKKTHSNEDEDYDSERKVCFGSIFKPQTNKYGYYYLKIPYNSIEFIFKRRYYFKKTVLDIFTINKKIYSFRFEENDMKTVYENIRHYMKSDIEDIFIEFTKYEEKIGFFNKKKLLNNKIQIPNTIKNMNLKYIYEKWAKWEISTFKLLMLLNFYANRSYNDINQYPVFPWIITDYISDNLSPVPPIRPMGTPMGMLDITEEAKERKENYLQSWALNENEVEKEEDFDRYRTHYSTSLYVTYYLVRIFPFSSMRIEIQGNNFDNPNRLFNSLYNSFYCALTQKSDIRELIPELFFFPELFYNINKLNLGEIKIKKTDVEIPVNDIEIPEWANKDGYIFVNKHRMFLESPEINEKINEWFNIIFGNKQNGKEAKRIGNLFVNQSYEYFYEIYNKSEQKDKINFCRMVEFGVTPNQIFKNEAYKRTNYNELKTKKNIFANITEIVKKNEKKILEISNEINLNEYNKNSNKLINTNPIKIFLELKSEEEGQKKKIYILNEEGSIKILKNIQQVPAVHRKILSSKHLNYNLTENQEDKKITKKVQAFNESILFLPRYRIDSKKSPSLFFNKGQCIALGGFWNGNILIEKIIIMNKNEKKDYPETKIYSTRNYSPIIHMIMDENELFAICGNILGTIFIFVINQNDKTDWNLYKTIYDHISPITSISINRTLNIFITCSKSGYCMLYTLPKCKLVNSYKLKNILNINNNSNNNDNAPLISVISLISSSPLPCIIFYFKSRSSLAIVSINGHFINERKIDFEINSNNIKLFTDNQFIDYLLIYNTKNETIEVYNIIELKMIMTWQIKNYSFIDFILSKDLDSIFVLVNYKKTIEEQDDENENDYKILVLKNANSIKQQTDLD